MNKIQQIIDLVERHPVKGSLAIDKDGHHVEPTDPEATGFCLIGAIAKVYDIKSRIAGEKEKCIEDVYEQLDHNPLVLALSKKLGGSNRPALHVAGYFDDESGVALAALKGIGKYYEGQ